jgi:hypothetical protein
MPQSCTTLPHEVDHVRSQEHHGLSTLGNLCWACARCNGMKGTDIAGHDPETDEPVRLFSPRTDSWDEHFDWHGPVLAGKTKIGRVTIDVLRINTQDRVEHRRHLILAGVFPPAGGPANPELTG